MSFFAVDNLGIRFGGVVAVDGVSFEVKEGECFSTNQFHFQTPCLLILFSPSFY